MLSESILNEAMKLACAEARKWLGATSPNPPVGAIALDSAGKTLATAAHQKAGELHAEAMLIEHLRARGMLKRIDTLCVTLEPCNHHGRTPPCTEAIVDAGIKRVVVGTRDPNTGVKGGGIEYLQKADVEVTVGVNEEECRQLIHAFAYAMKNSKTWVTVKRAFDSKGSMIPPPGKKIFTGPDAIRLAHRLRKKADAILTGSGTILADNPLFTVRYAPDFGDKRRLLGILTRRGRVPQEYIKAAHERGLDVIIFQSLEEAFKGLTERGAQDILVEAGPSVSQAVFDDGHWAMKVDIHQGKPDRIEVGFKPGEDLPFDKKKFQWEWMLPQ